MIKAYNCVVVLGATASGKTKLAAALAAHFGAEIISADSRQVYKHLDIGTGKDLNEYVVDGNPILFHAINCAEPGEQFYLHNFIEVLDEAFTAIQGRCKLPIIAGGTGLYLDALNKDFSLTAIPENHELRAELSSKDKSELLTLLNTYDSELTRHIDRNSSKRIIRGIEIASYLSQHQLPAKKTRPSIRPLYIGITTSAQDRTQLIQNRLQHRLDNGLIEEAQTLLNMGLTHQRLQRLGLEYKYLSNYLQHLISRQELQEQLATAILQYSKRQMTWFRKMEKEGISIKWFEPQTPLNAVIEYIAPHFNSKI